MSKRAKEITVATFAVIGAVIALYLAFSQRSPKINLGPYDVLGAVAAEETAKLLGNKGQVLVMAPDTGAYKNPSTEAELSAFQRTLKPQKEMSVLTERISATPVQMMATGGGVTSDQLFKALERHAGLGALVLFLGLPPLTEPELASLKKSGVKIVVVSSFRPGYQRLMEEQVLHLAIMPRTEPPPEGAPPPRTVRERFDQEFIMLSPAAAARQR